MRCYCCNKQLSDREATRRFEESGEFVDMCDKCLNTIDDEELGVTDGYQGEEFDSEGGFDLDDYE